MSEDETDKEDNFDKATSTEVNSMGFDTNANNLVLSIFSPYCSQFDQFILRDFRSQN